MWSAGARLSSRSARSAQAVNNLESTFREHSDQRGTCHSESSPTPSAAVHHPACWNKNTAPPQPLAVSPWQPGDWWGDVIVNTHIHAHVGWWMPLRWIMAWGIYHLFNRAPSPRIPIGLTRWPSPKSASLPPPPPPLPSVHLFFTPLWNKATVTQSLWEYQFCLSILSLKYLPTVPNPEWPECHQQGEWKLYNVLCFYQEHNERCEKERKWWINLLCQN